MLSLKDIPLLERPGKSQDLNPTENYWNQMTQAWSLQHLITDSPHSDHDPKDPKEGPKILEEPSQFHTQMSAVGNQNPNEMTKHY